MFDDLKLKSYSYELQANGPTNCQVFLLTFHDHKQQLTFLQRFKLIAGFIPCMIFFVNLKHFPRNPAI